MKSLRSWPALLGLLLTLASANGMTQGARPSIPPLPPGPTSLPPLDARALEALRPTNTLALEPASPPPSSLRKIMPAPPDIAVEEATRRIELSLKICKFDYYPKAPQFSLRADAAVVKLTFTGDKGCLTAVSADKPWVEASMRSFRQEVVISVGANTDARTRTAKVFIVASSAQLEFSVTQEGAAGEQAPVAEPAAQDVALPGAPSPYRSSNETSSRSPAQLTETPASRPVDPPGAAAGLHSLASPQTGKRDRKAQDSGSIAAAAAQTAPNSSSGSTSTRAYAPKETTFPLEEGPSVVHEKAGSKPTSVAQPLTEKPSAAPPAEPGVLVSKEAAPSTLGGETPAEPIEAKRSYDIPGPPTVAEPGESDLAREAPERPQMVSAQMPDDEQPQPPATEDPPPLVNVPPPAPTERTTDTPGEGYEELDLSEGPPTN